jgi:hypothetical protein
MPESYQASKRNYEGVSYSAISMLSMVLFICTDYNNTQVEVQQGAAFGTYNQQNTLYQISSSRTGRAVELDAGLWL